MTLEEMLNLKTGRYSVLIQKKSMTMFISHDGSLGSDKISFQFGLEDNIVLDIESCKWNELPLVVTINELEFINVVEHSDIVFSSSLKYN